MRQGQQNRRNRGRGRNNRSGNPLSRNYESNGPEVKIKGSAAHIAEKYMALARDALSSGNTVTAENYFQHAEHYNRIIQAAQAKQEENAAAHSSSSSAQNPSANKSGGRNNNERRPKPQRDSGEAPAKNAEAAPVPGSGEQPVLNGNGATVETTEEKPKRKPRPRRPKVAKTEAKDAPEPKDEQSNITA